LFASFEIFANRTDLPLWPHHDHAGSKRSALMAGVAPVGAPDREPQG